MMRFVLLIGAPAILGFYCIMLSPSLPKAILAVLAILLSSIAAAFKKAAYVTAAASVCVLNYFITLPSSGENLHLWEPIVFGLALYLYIEIGNDVLRVLPQDIPIRSYRIRFRYLFIVLICTTAGSLIVLTLAYNFAFYLPGIVTLPLILAGLVAIVLGLGVITIYRIHRPD